MKKALLLALAALVASAAPALAYPPAPANVNFTSERGLPFSLVLDGRPLTRGVARQVHVDQLMPGQHWADFSVPTPYGGAVRYRSRVWLEPGVETSFVLVARPGWPLCLRQVSAVSLYGPRGGHRYPGRGYGYGGAYNSPQPYGPSPAYPAPGGSYPSQGNPGSYPGNGSNGYPNNDSYPGNNGNGYPSNNGYPGGYPSNSTPNAPGYPGSGGVSYPGTATSSYRTLPAPEVAGLLQAVQRERSDTDKLRTAKQVLAQGAVSADDLKRLLQALANDSARVDLATFGYAHVTDPDNFERVFDALQTEASKQALDEALSAEPQN